MTDDMVTDSNFEVLYSVSLLSAGSLSLTDNIPFNPNILVGGRGYPRIQQPRVREWP